MSINLPADLQTIIRDEALRLNTTPDQVVEQLVRRHLSMTTQLAPPLLEPRDDWERRLRAIAIDCGVSLSDEALSSEGLYD
jgi:hypothetical protein